MGNKQSTSGKKTSAFVHPGNRRKPMQPYAPSVSQFSNGQATAHFVCYGGGNALVLKQGNGVAQPEVGAVPAGQPECVQVTLPAGVTSGQKIHVQAPDGRLNEIIVPQGMTEGSVFTVEFADNNLPPPTAAEAVPVSAAVATAQQPPRQTVNNYDDRFASGFGNANHNPDYVQATIAINDNYSSYPTATDAEVVHVDASPQATTRYTPNYTLTYAPYVSK